MDPYKKEQLEKQCMDYSLWVCSLYNMQYDAGRFFLLGHPYSASSWKIHKVIDIASFPGVREVVGDMCQFDVKVDGELVRKRFGFLTNSACIAKALDRRCWNDDPSAVRKHHMHVRLISGKSKQAEDYTKQIREGCSWRTEG